MAKKYNPYFFNPDNRGANGMRENYYGVVLNDSIFGGFTDRRGRPLLPNPYGQTAAIQALNHLTSEEGTITTLNEYLIELRDKMYKTEDLYLTQKIEYLKANDPYFTENKKGRAMIEAIINAKEHGTYSEVFTLLYNCKQDLNELNRQLNKNLDEIRKGSRSISSRGAAHFTHMFETIKIGDVLNKNNPALWEKFTSSFTAKGARGDLDDNFFRDLAYEISKEAFKKVESDGTQVNDDLKQSYTELLINTFKVNNLMSMTEEEKELIRQYNEAKSKGDKVLAEKLRNQDRGLFVKVADKYTKKGHARRSSTIGREMLNDAYQGILGELIQQVLGKDMHVTADVSHGRVMTQKTTVSGNSYKRQGITDNFSIDILWDELETEYLRHFKNIPEMKNVTEKANAIKKLSEQLILEHNSSKEVIDSFFEIHTNVKAYKGGDDLFVAREYAIENVGGRLRKISDELSLRRQEGVTDEKAATYIKRQEAVDELIFLLNSTFERGFACESIKNLEKLIASVCWAWIWDTADIDLTRISDAYDNNVNKILLFESGTAFFSGAQIIEQARKYLISAVARRDLEGGFVDVIIKPSKRITNNFYHSLVEKYPARDREDEDYQENLKKRWVELRNTSLATTKMAINFKQEALDKLLGNLSLFNRLNNRMHI